jgi:hypothetical protein
VFFDPDFSSGRASLTEAGKDALEAEFKGEGYGEDL